MTRWMRAAAGMAAAWLLGTAVPVSGQTGARVSVLMQETPRCTVTPCRTTQLFTVAPDQGRLVASDLVNDSPGAGQVWVSPDGAFQVWLTVTLQGQLPVYSLLIRNVVDGSLLRAPVASDSMAFVGSPVALEVYLSDFDSPYALSPAVVRRLAADPAIHVATGDASVLGRGIR